MRSGGKGMWGRGLALYKHNYNIYFDPHYWKTADCASRIQVVIFALILIVNSAGCSSRIKVVIFAQILRTAGYSSMIQVVIFVKTHINGERL
jgi:hypothetical protein